MILEVQIQNFGARHRQRHKRHFTRFLQVNNFFGTFSKILT